MSAEQLLAQEFGAFPDLIRAHACERTDHPALIEGDAILTYRELAALMDRVAFALQRDAVGAGEAWRSAREPRSPMRRFSAVFWRREPLWRRWRHPRRPRALL
jgi:hypothetical protein